MPQSRDNSRTPRKKRGKLSRAKWLDAGLALLTEQGINGVKLANLTRYLCVSIGSFYHHFRDMKDFTRALSDHYADHIVVDLIQDVIASSEDPIEQLKQLYLRTEKRDLLKLDSAMRSLALIEPEAADAMNRGEKRVLNFMSDALVRTGLEEEDARARAFAMLSMEMASVLMQNDEDLHPLRRRAFAILSS